MMSLGSSESGSKRCMITSTRALEPDPESAGSSMNCVMSGIGRTPRFRDLCPSEFWRPSREPDPPVRRVEWKNKQFRPFLHVYGGDPQVFSVWGSLNRGPAPIPHMTTTNGSAEAG